MSELVPWLFGALLAVAVGVAIWFTRRRGRVHQVEDRYSLALEMWLSGDKNGAVSQLRKIIAEDPKAIDPYLQLGNLLRETGDPRRAAVLHLGLTVRSDLDPAKRITVGLALAEDLIGLENWQAAATVLDELSTKAGNNSHYLWCRFAQLQGAGALPEAARTLDRAARHGAQEDREAFRSAYASFQLDRALQHLRRGELNEARSRLKDVRKNPAARERAAYVKALIAAREDDVETAIGIAGKELLDSPTELALFLPVLQEVLLQTGQYAKTIPILENACRSRQSPPSLWIALALLYEKLDQRDKAIRLLEGKRGDPRFTPDRAAPYLRLLAAEEPASDFGRVWEMLAAPGGTAGWTCTNCGREESEIRWFCSACRSCDSFVQKACLAQEATDFRPTAPGNLSPSVPVQH